MEVIVRWLMKIELEKAEKLPGTPCPKVHMFKPLLSPTQVNLLTDMVHADSLGYDLTKCEWASVKLII